VGWINFSASWVSEALFEQLGEEYPDTLGTSIIAAEGAIANVIGVAQIKVDFYFTITPVITKFEPVQQPDSSPDSFPLSFLRLILFTSRSWGRIRASTGLGAHLL
jgi:hypothetical protein